MLVVALEWRQPGLLDDPNAVLPLNVVASASTRSPGFSAAARRNRRGRHRNWHVMAFPRAGVLPDYHCVSTAGNLVPLITQTC